MIKAEHKFVVDCCGPLKIPQWFVLKSVRLYELKKKKEVKSKHGSKVNMLLTERMDFWWDRIFQILSEQFISSCHHREKGVLVSAALQV